MNASTIAFTMSYGLKLEYNGSENLNADQLPPELLNRNNETLWNPLEPQSEPTDEYIFDRMYVRVIFIVLYTIVFCFCVLGNLMVILVVTLHWRMRNITKFCLANLAFADFCVGIFCVYQNLSVYLINSWVLGEVLCKMYHFINALSHTSSVLILVVICMERYLAILHPFKCKQILTKGRLRVLIIGVWLISAVYCSPRLYYMVTLAIPRLDGGTEIICTAKRTLYDSRLFDMIHFFLLFLLPLLIITVLYTCVGVTLWKSSLIPSSSSIRPFKPLTQPSCFFRRRRFKSINSADTPMQQDFAPSKQQPSPPGDSGDSSSSHNGTNLTPSSSETAGRKSRKKHCTKMRRSPSYTITVENKCYIVGEGVDTQVMDVRRPSQLVVTSGKSPEGIPTPGGGSNRFHHRAPSVKSESGNGAPALCRQLTRTPSRMVLNGRDNCRKSGKDPLKSRQTVVRMMIVIVVSFAVCNFPFHLRKLILYWWPNFDYTSHFSTLATPVTHLIMYVNCAINPMIYAFMSKAFRSSFIDLLCCRLKKKHQANVNYSGVAKGSIAQTNAVNKQDDGEDTD